MAVGETLTIMTTHELAAKLLTTENLPVVINGWGACEGFTFEVTEVKAPAMDTFQGANDTEDTPKTKMLYPVDRLCIMLDHNEQL